MATVRAAADVAAWPRSRKHVEEMKLPCGRNAPAKQSAEDSGKARKGDGADCDFFGTSKRCKFRPSRFPRGFRGSSHVDFNGAANLLFGYGSEEQLAQYIRALRTAKADDPLRYWVLWHAALLRKSARVLQAVAVLIDDERSAKQQSSYEGMRYCDIAVIRLQEVTGRQFGLVTGNQKPDERDRAVRHARDWLHRNIN
jgi:hypothetical protein